MPHIFSYIKGESMCGICACIGNLNAVKYVLDGLKILEYRGYDSAGISYIENKELKTIKSVGEICNLEKKVKGIFSNVAIGHTRWATHGSVTEDNAHPHLSFNKGIAIVHNGIVENYKDLKEKLKNVKWHSQTDTEVFVNLVAGKEGDLLEKLINASKEISGSFAVALLDKDGNIVFGKRESPLYIAHINNGVMAVSDTYVLCDLAEDFYTLNDNEFAKINGNEIFFYDKNGKKIIKNKEKMQNFNKNNEIFEKTHMKSEILETKKVLTETFKNYQNELLFSSIKLLKKFEEIELIACGTAYHSALQGAEYFKKIGIPSHAYIASEFRYGNEILNKNALYIFVSQSGETADTIACAKMLKEKNMTCLALTNTPNSYLNKICENVLPTFAGKEIAVASTKAYSCQVFVLYLFSLYLSGKFKESEKEILYFLKNFPLLDINNDLVDKISNFEKIFFIGRGQDYITALEGSLKLKEITYINSFAIASGELKHGTLALIDKKSIVIAICTEEKIKEKLFSNIEEVKAREGSVLLITNFPSSFESLILPTFPTALMPIISIIPLQFLALHMCEKLGYNPDKPKNLAKSVTVE